MNLIANALLIQHFFKLTVLVIIQNEGEDYTKFHVS